ncbi:hypothetical protein D9M69_684230 [compost metagenome]
MYVDRPILGPPNLRRTNRKARRKLSIGNIDMHTLRKAMNMLDLRLIVVGSFRQEGWDNHAHR